MRVQLVAMGQALSTSFLPALRRPKRVVIARVGYPPPTASQYCGRGRRSRGRRCWPAPDSRLPPMFPRTCSTSCWICISRRGYAPCEYPCGRRRAEIRVQVWTKSLLLVSWLSLRVVVYRQWLLSVTP